MRQHGTQCMCPAAMRGQLLLVSQLYHNVGPLCRVFGVQALLIQPRCLIYLHTTAVSHMHICSASHTCVCAFTLRHMMQAHRVCRHNSYGATFAPSILRPHNTQCMCPAALRQQQLLQSELYQNVVPLGMMFVVYAWLFQPPCWLCLWCCMLRCFSCGRFRAALRACPTYVAA